MTLYNLMYVSHVWVLGGRSCCFSFDITWTQTITYPFNVQLVNVSIEPLFSLIDGCYILGNSSSKYLNVFIDLDR
jgi:hypothetical protein